jgi:hypothetical protein
MKKIPITEATDQQLKAFASDQQIENVPNARGGILAALTEAGWTGDYIFADGDEGPAASAEAPQLEPVAQYEEAGEKPLEMQPTGFAYWRNSPMVVCRVMATDRPGGNDPAHPIINSSAALIIPRGKLVKIPIDFYRVLKNAGGTKITHADDRPGLPPREIRQDYQEYPMQDVVLPSARAVAEWDEWSGQHELGASKKVEPFRSKIAA